MPWCSSTSTSSTTLCRVASIGTHLLQRGTDIHTIQQLLGHIDLATTMIYTHILWHGGQGASSPLDERGVWFFCLICLTTGISGTNGRQVDQANPRCRTMS